MLSLQTSSFSLFLYSTSSLVDSLVVFFSDLVDFVDFLSDFFVDFVLSSLDFSVVVDFLSDFFVVVDFLSDSFVVVDFLSDSFVVVDFLSDSFVVVDFLLDFFVVVDSLPDSSVVFVDFLVSSLDSFVVVSVFSLDEVSVLPNVVAPSSTSDHGIRK